MSIFAIHIHHRFTLEAYSFTGGHLDVRNLDSDVTTRHHYSGTAATGATAVVLDLEAPTHCSLVSALSCLPGQSILDLGPEITAANLTAVGWGGWEDIPSGIVNYTLEVLAVVVMDGVLREESRIQRHVLSHTGQPTYRVNVSLPNEGPYSFLLHAIDLATNVRTARRLLLYDATSNLTVDPGAPLRVVSAVPESEHLWQNSSMDPLVINGRGHFYNTHLRTHDYLAPVANHSRVESEFDHPLDSGRYPRSGTPNALGVMRLLYEVVVDHEGGVSAASTTQPDVFSSETDNLAIDDLEVNVSAADGDSIRVWFLATDFNGVAEADSVLVHVDSSAPVLLDLWLEYAGNAGIFLHGTDSMLDLNIQFRTYDEHR